MNTTIFYLNINFNSLLKLIFIALLLVAHIVFIANENSKPEELKFNIENVKNAGIIDGGAIKKIGGYFVGVTAFTSSILTIKNEIKSKAEAERLSKKIAEMQDQLTEIQETVSIKNTPLNTGAAQHFTNEFINSQNYLNTMKTNVNNICNIYMDPVSPIAESKILALIQEKNSFFSATEKLEKTAQEQIKALDTIETKESLILFSDLISYLDKYESYSKLFISLLLFKYLILGSCLSILFIIYGNFLIERFNIQTKYPKLYNILSLRIKYQKYYLIMNIAFIAIIALTEIILILYLLY